VGPSIGLDALVAAASNCWIPITVAVKRTCACAISVLSFVTLSRALASITSAARFCSETCSRCATNLASSASYSCTSSFCWSLNDPIKCMVRLASSALPARAIAAIAVSSRPLPALMYASTAACCRFSCATSSSCCVLRTCASSRVSLACKTFHCACAACAALRSSGNAPPYSSRSLPASARCASSLSP
jgi:hypothetical protein